MMYFYSISVSPIYFRNILNAVQKFKNHNNALFITQFVNEFSPKHTCKWSPVLSGKTIICLESVDGTVTPIPAGGELLISSTMTRDHSERI